MLGTESWNIERIVLKMGKKTLDFDEIYIRKILEEKKITTIRRGVRNFKVGEKVLITSQDRIYAEAEITEIRRLKVSDLTDEDALKDGFSSKEELLRALKKYYSSIRPSDTVTIIGFKILKKFSDF
ncbi:MAG: ASCH domain-containing protein [Candidatus Baldrarchaeia archaeon]